MMILGSCLTAGVIANITSMAHKVVISEDNAQHVQTCVEKYMVEKELPYDLRERCLRYFHTLSGDSDESKILSELVPPPFLPEIALHIYSELLKSSPIILSAFKRELVPREKLTDDGKGFNQFNIAKSKSRTTKIATYVANKGFVRSMALLLKEEIVVEGEWIINNNPNHNRWYSVKDGQVQLKRIGDEETVCFVPLNPLQAHTADLFNSGSKSGMGSYFSKSSTRNSMTERERERSVKEKSIRMTKSSFDMFGGGEGNERKSFGEHYLFYPQRVLYHAKAATNCSLIYLNPEDFATLSNKYQTEFSMMKTWVDEVEIERINQMINHDDELGRAERNAKKLDTDKKGRHIVLMQQLSDIQRLAVDKHRLRKTLDNVANFFLDLITGRRVYHPEGGFLISWNIIVFIFLIYNIFAIPYRVSFLGNSDDTRGDGSNGKQVSGFLGLIIITADLKLTLSLLSPLSLLLALSSFPRFAARSLGNYVLIRLRR